MKLRRKAGEGEAQMSRDVRLTIKELVVDHVHTTLYQEDWQWQPSLSEALDDAGLSRHVVWYKGGGSHPLAMRIVRTTTHDIYHSGQIRYLRALQGAG